MKFWPNFPIINYTKMIKNTIPNRKSDPNLLDDSFLKNARSIAYPNDRRTYNKLGIYFELM